MVFEIQTTYDASEEGGGEWDGLEPPLSSSSFPKVHLSLVPSDAHLPLLPLSPLTISSMPATVSPFLSPATQQSPKYNSSTLAQSTPNLAPPCTHKYHHQFLS